MKSKVPQELGELASEGMAVENQTANDVLSENSSLMGMKGPSSGEKRNQCSRLCL